MISNYIKKEVWVYAKNKKCDINYNDFNDSNNNDILYIYKCCGIKEWYRI